MKKFDKYKKELTDEKDRIVALYGVDITKSLYHEYLGDFHSMDIEEKVCKFFNDKQNQNLETNISNENYGELNSLQNYEKEISGDNTTN